MQRVFVKPKNPNTRVPDRQDGGYYPTSGKWTDRDMYVERRLREANGLEISAPPASVPEPEPIVEPTPSTTKAEAAAAAGGTTKASAEAREKKRGE